MYVLIFHFYLFDGKKEHIKFFRGLSYCLKTEIKKDILSMYSLFALINILMKIKVLNLCVCVYVFVFEI